MDSVEKGLFPDIFPFFRGASQYLVENILSFFRQMTLPVNMLVKLEGDQCHDFVLMLSGEKRIFKMGGTGRAS